MLLHNKVDKAYCFAAHLFRENPQNIPVMEKTVKIHLLLQFNNATSGGTVAQNISLKKINFFKPPYPMSLSNPFLSSSFSLTG
jgi:hypothetical protein